MIEALDERWRRKEGRKTAYVPRIEAGLWIVVWVRWSWLVTLGEPVVPPLEQP